MDSPAAERNKEPISNVLANYLPSSGHVLEIASGTGQHIVHFATQFTHLNWTASEQHESASASIRERCDRAQLKNLNPPILLDVLRHDWRKTSANFIINCNMIHISARASCPALFKGAALVLQAGERLFLYGPFRFADRPLESSNVQFEKWLYSLDPGFGLWKLEDVAKVAQNAGFAVEAIVPMPAHNHSIIFQRNAT